LIISWPKKIRPQKVETLTELIDLPLTLLDAVQIVPHIGMQGKSFWSLLMGNDVSNYHKEDVYSEYYNAMPWHTNPTAQSTMVRTERYKLAVDHVHSFGELYDLREDPDETHNLWDIKEYNQLKTDMLLRLCNRMAFTVDPLPQRRGDF
jgi:arylsulfatase A-like enzyme